MKSIENIDKNLKVETSIEREGIKFYDANSEPFKIYGVYKDDGRYRRMPEDVAKNTSEGVWELHACTAGGRVRFKTDSSYVAIQAKMNPIYKMSHFALTGVGGFDLYAKEGDMELRFAAEYTPPYDIKDGYESIIDLCNGGFTYTEGEMREIVINFPLYAGVIDLYIGLDENAKVLPPDEYKNQKPIVYYGSSITQGGCASRPGMSYQNIITRRFNVDHINLGFSGNAKAEDAMIEYIKNLDMSVFVYDYDHNAPSVEYLRETHEKMFKAIREANPDLPIVMMPRPKHFLTDTDKQRAEIVKTTYENAIKSGDKNVYHINGEELMALCGDQGTVDNCHPTDLGFFSMAKTLGDALEKWGLV